jgi:hypothetical protein
MIEQRIEGLHRTREDFQNEPLTETDLPRQEDGERMAASYNEPAVTESPLQQYADRIPLFAENELGDSRRRWQDLQGSFVDDPRTAVHKADELVASLMSRLTQVFADERGKLESEWGKGDNVSTETLRVAMQRYRSFFDRLLSV